MLLNNFGQVKVGGLVLAKRPLEWPLVDSARLVAEYWRAYAFAIAAVGQVESFHLYLLGQIYDDSSGFALISQADDLQQIKADFQRAYKI